ncbi:MAG TPA: DUF2608 domain-containing protein [Candidatus Megaira endosymbiont of Nemacystus decipiens]|nr:DUF2608 domain-containing protein [Candidatus Megaera endosymbiont of Nemacystus decipiens]
MLKKILILVSYVMLISKSHAEIIELQNAKEILKYTTDLTKNDLISFDVKNVLFEPKDLILRANNKKEMKNYFLQLEQELGKEEAARLDSILTASYKPILVDKDMPFVVRELQMRGVRVIALTSGKIGKYFDIKSLENLRIMRLKRLDFDFSNSFPNFPEIKFYDQDKDVNFSFNSGVLFTSRVSKGKVIPVFLNRTQFKPSKIVHVDNVMKKLIAVQDFCAKNNIKFLGLHFTKSYLKDTKIDKALSDKKFEILKKEKRWPSDL